ncbi:hypothetical protein ACHAXS_012191 [Conticribra weissflogii]
MKNWKMLTNFSIYMQQQYKNSICCHIHGCNQDIAKKGFRLKIEDNFKLIASLNLKFGARITGLISVQAYKDWNATLLCQTLKARHCICSRQVYIIRVFSPLKSNEGSDSCVAYKYNDSCAIPYHSTYRQHGNNIYGSKHHYNNITKHVDLRYKFVNEYVGDGTVKIIFNYADILTKI